MTISLENNISECKIGFLQNNENYNKLLYFAFNYISQKKNIKKITIDPLPTDVSLNIFKDIGFYRKNWSSLWEIKFDEFITILKKKNINFLKIKCYIEDKDSIENNDINKKTDNDEFINKKADNDEFLRYKNGKENINIFNIGAICRTRKEGIKSDYKNLLMDMNRLYILTDGGIFKSFGIHYVSKNDNEYSIKLNDVLKIYNNSIKQSENKIIEEFEKEKISNPELINDEDFLRLYKRKINNMKEYMKKIENANEFWIKLGSISIQNYNHVLEFDAGCLPRGGGHKLLCLTFNYIYKKNIIQEKINLRAVSGSEDAYIKMGFLLVP